VRLDAASSLDRDISTRAAHLPADTHDLVVQELRKYIGFSFFFFFLQIGDINILPYKHLLETSTSQN